MTTTVSAELTTESFLQDSELCEKLYRDLYDEYCCTFCDEPYERCVSGEGDISKSNVMF